MQNSFANKLMHGDCLELMPLLPDKSIDCIIADLPYGITNLKWDSVIPFEPLWVQYKRLIKPNGAIVLFGSQPFTSALVMSNPKWFKYEWIWEKSKSTGFLNCNWQPLKSHEGILLFGEFKCSPSNQQNKNFNPQMSFGKPYRDKGSNVKASIYNLYKKASNDNKGTRYPKSVIKFANPNYKSIHPTQKPVPLLEYLIKTYTTEGELILDNTAGSGSLAIAALNTKRNYICIEKDDHYFEVMSNRIAAHIPIYTEAEDVD